MLANAIAWMADNNSETSITFKQLGGWAATVLGAVLGVLVIMAINGVMSGQEQARNDMVRITGELQSLRASFDAYKNSQEMSNSFRDRIDSAKDAAQDAEIEKVKKSVEEFMGRVMDKEAKLRQEPKK